MASTLVVLRAVRVTESPPESRSHRVTEPRGSSERHLVVRIGPVPYRRPIVERCVDRGRWCGRTGRAAARSRRGIRARRAVARRPDHPLAAWTASLARLVAALEVRRARIALRGAVVPHRAAADRAERHAVGVDARGGMRAGTGTRRQRRRARTSLAALSGRLRRGWRCVARWPDDPVAAPVLALEVRGLGVPLPLAIVPHRTPALGAAGNVRGRRGRLGHTAARSRKGYRR